MRAIQFGLLWFSICSTDGWAHQSHAHPQPPQKAKETVEQPENIQLKRIGEDYRRTVRPIFERKCFDCHSSQTRYPWYHSLPIIKGVMDRDIAEGREHIDMSEDFPFQGHGTPREDLEAIRKSITEGTMPPWYYRLMHWNAGLTEREHGAVLEWVGESLKTLEPR